MRVMPTSLKILLFAIGGLVAFLVLVALTLLLFGDVSAKSRLEKAASDALGMEVTVGDRLSIRFFPGLHVTLEDVHIRSQGGEVASAQEASLWIELLPLLHKEVRIEKIGLKRPRISIERDRDGKFNFAQSEGVKGRFPTLDLANVSLSNGTLLYADKQTGEGFTAGNCNLDVSRRQLLEGKSADLSPSFSYTAEFVCGKLRTKALTVSDLKFSIDGKAGVFDLKPITLSLFGGQGLGSIQADFSGAIPRYHVQYSLSKFRLAEFLKALSPKNVAEGSMDFTTNVSMQGKTTNEMKQTANGEASLHGEHLTLDGSDLDREFSRYESSQSFNLVDMGAFFFAGPLGLAITKGYNFASIFQGSGGRSTIRTLVSDWKVERGVAQAKDVAMATNEHRIALKGGLDFVNERFADVTVALIDAKGCPRVQQTIRGSFQKPVVEKPSVLTSLAGPALKLLKQARDLFRGQCEVFYAGAVAPPK
jgi:uncharacterized protein involved in outer membrane biogenesis